MTENSREKSELSLYQGPNFSRIFSGRQLNFGFPESSHTQDNAEFAQAAAGISSASSKQYQAVVLK